jgi:hypothetical protein
MSVGQPGAHGAWASEAEAGAIVLGFLERTLPLARWTHASHLTVAVYLCTQREDGVAERDLPRLIQGYNAAMGVPSETLRGYHDTITVFHLRAVRSFLTRVPRDAGLAALANRLVASPFGARDLVLTYYSREHLFSDEAKLAFLEPDLRPIDFGALSID